MAKIIVVSKLGRKKGQTLFAAHLAAFLATTHQTALVDFEPQKHILENFVAQRHFFNLKHNQNLPVPTYFEYKPNLLSKISADFDFAVLDAKQESLFEYADMVLTLLSDKQEIKTISTKNSAFSNMLWQAKMNRAKQGKNAFMHVLILNDLFDESEIQNLKKNASLLGYLVAPYLKQNRAYAEGVKKGVTVLDKDVPFLLKNFDEDDFFARRNLKQILEFIWSDK